MLKLITGTPGTGKHTISRLVAKKMGLELVDVRQAAVEAGLARRNRGVLEVDVAQLKNVLYKQVPKDSLLVGHLAPYVVSKSRVEAAAVLRRSPYSLSRVYRERKYQRKKSLENLGSEILGVTYYDTLKIFGRKKTFQFDTTDTAIRETARRVESLFAKGSAKEDNVDWLASVSSRGDLAKFFPY